MSLSPFQAMQAAVDIVNDSPHPTNKIAASLFGRGANGKDFLVSRTNAWPAPIDQKIGRQTEIGNSSGTAHAETLCILSTPSGTDNASLCVTDPFCPNCAKNVAEAGIKTVYIDHKGFHKDFFSRRSGSFKDMSMQICEKAGISIYEIWRKEEKLVPIYVAPKDFIPREDDPIETEPVTGDLKKNFEKKISEKTEKHKRRRHALAIAKNPAGIPVCLTARAHPVIGFTMQKDLQLIEGPHGKYSLIQEPVNRLLMYAARMGLNIQEEYFYCSLVPTAREQVNMTAAGFKRIAVGDITRGRDAYAIAAMHLMKIKGVLDFY